MDLNQSQDAFEKLVEDLDKNVLAEFFRWIQRRYLVATCSGSAPAVAHGKLRQIAKDIRESIPLNAILPSESIKHPTSGENADFDPRHTLHMDAFLYEDYEIDDLVHEGKMSRNYCKDCHSNNVSPITFFSHSASMRKISFVYQSLLPFLPQDKVVVDVGSRLGAMVYGAYLYTKAGKIIGVEMNEELCKIQQAAIDKYRMGDRVKIMNCDVCSVPEVIQGADVVILHNVFEFFLSPEDQTKAWQFLRKNITKKGALMVTVPSLEKSLKELQTGIDLSKWVKKQPITEPLTAMTAEDCPELLEICVYEVL